MQEFANLTNFVWCKNKFWVGFFDYLMLLRATRIMEDSDSNDEDVESLYPNRAQVAHFSHPFGPNMADGSETLSDEPDSDSDDDSVSSADSDNPVIPIRVIRN